MECPDIRYYLLDYYDGELAPGLVIEFKRHLGNCRSCAELVKHFEQVGATIQSEKEQEPNPFASTRILQYLENKHLGRKHRYIPAFRPVMITLALILALAAGFLIGNLGQSWNTDPVSSEQEMEMLKSNLYISDFVDEDLGMLTNQ